MLISRTDWNYGSEDVLVYKKTLSLLLEINGMQYEKSNTGDGWLFLLIGGLMNEVKRRV